MVFFAGQILTSAQLNAILTRLDTLEADTGWIAPTFQNSWANYVTGFAPAGYRKKNGIVYLRGLVASGAQTVPMFTLPAGFRPGFNILVPASTNAQVFNTGAASTGTAHTHVNSAPELWVRMDIGLNGTVTLTSAASATGYVSLNGISFIAEL